MRSSGLAELFAGEDQAGLLAQPVDRLRGGELLAAFHGRLDVGTLRRRLLDAGDDRRRGRRHRPGLRKTEHQPADLAAPAASTGVGGSSHPNAVRQGSPVGWRPTPAPGHRRKPMRHTTAANNERRRFLDRRNQTDEAAGNLEFVRCAPRERVKLEVYGRVPRLVRSVAVRKLAPHGRRLGLAVGNALDVWPVSATIIHQHPWPESGRLLARVHPRPGRERARVRFLHPRHRLCDTAVRPVLHRAG